MSKNPLRIKNIHDLNYLKHKFKSLPKEKVTSNIVETAENIRTFGTGTPFPGKYMYERTPYMYEIAMECSPQSPTEVINVMKAGQMGATAGSTENLILFKIAQDPGPVLAMVPNEQFGKKWDESRISPMIERAGLMSKLTSTVKKGSQHGGNGNTSLKKTWTGGRLDILSFAQVNQLRNQSYQIIIIEDAEEIGNTAQRGVNQGSLKKVAFTRTMTFSGRRKILDISTPLILETSTIHPEFLKGDQRYYYIKCPDCGHQQRLIWKHLKYFTGEHGIVDIESVYYECQGNHNNVSCTFKIKNEMKTDFLLCEELGGTAKWIPHNAEKARPFTKSYQISALYAPAGMDTWAQLAQQWVDAQHNPEDLQAFINLKLGEPFMDQSDSPPPETLHVLKGTYKRNTLPSAEEGQVLFTMLGCDVQHGNKRGGEWIPGKEPRIEASLWGFGLNDRMWLLDHRIYRGEVTDYRSGAFLLLKRSLLDKEFIIQPVKIFIDAKHQGGEVKKFCDRSTNIFPIMGDARIKEKLFRKIDLIDFRNSEGMPLPLYELKTHDIKRRIYNRLKTSNIDPLSKEYSHGYMMFPADIESKYFEQLTAERMIPVSKFGKVVGHQFDAGGRANETLDTTCYAVMAKEVWMYEMSVRNGEEVVNEKQFWRYCYKRYIKMIEKIA